MNANEAMTKEEPLATRRDWIGLAVLALPCLLYSMDLSVLNLAIPAISKDLNPSSTELLWMIDIYGFLVAGCLITMGTLGDRIGRRKLLLIGAAAFGVMSVIAAFSTSPEMLIASRALLGIAGATLAPSTLSLIRNMFLNPRQRTVAISVWITSYSAGGALGPALGGVLLEYFWWGSVFLLAVPVMVLLLAAGPILLPEYRDSSAGKPDALSTGLSLAAVLTLIYGLKQVAEHGIEMTPVGCIAVGGVLGAGFLVRQTRLSNPMIDLSLFRLPSFSASLATYMLGGMVMFGIFVFVSQYLQLVLGLTPLTAGLWTMPFALAFVAGSMVTPILVRHRRPVAVMVPGLLLAAAGFALLAQIDGSSGLEDVVPALVIFSLGLAPVFTLTTDMMIGSAPPERAGAAAAISETCAEFGGALGVAVLGSIGTVLYRQQMAGSMPADLSPEASETARRTLGGAVSVAEKLGGDTGAQLLVAARDAFSQSLELTAWLAAIAFSLLAIMVFALLRDVQPGTKDEGEVEQEAFVSDKRERLAVEA